MIRLFDLSQPSEWDAVVRSFSEWDVYYLSGYVKAFHIHGDGDPFLLYYESPSLRAIYVYMRRQTALAGFFDSVTPYGYGGVLFDGNLTDKSKQDFWQEYLALMEQEHIVDNFVRYHPVLQNAIPMKSISNVIDLGKTIAINLASPEIIWNNIISKNRHMIRKAAKNGVEIHHGKDYHLFQDFKRIYNATMDKDHADDYYFFEDAFYESVYRDLSSNFELFYALFEGKIIAISIMLFANGQMHYHLSGSLQEYRNLAPSNLLLYKAAIWGYEQGFKSLHLGGGVGSGDDNLYKFKAAFNKNSDYQFSIGKQIFNPLIYDKLGEIRAISDASFDSTSHFFPLYRA